jgi:hypothetical protein
MYLAQEGYCNTLQAFKNISYITNRAPPLPLQYLLIQMWGNIATLISQCGEIVHFLGRNWNQIWDLM